MNENNAIKDDGVIEIDLLGVFKRLWKRKFFLILAGILGGVIAFAITYFFITPKYTASVYLYANNTSTEQHQNGMVTSSDLSASARVVDTYAAMICRDIVLDKVIQETGIDITPEELAKNVVVEAENETEVFRVSVTSTEPGYAMTLANGIAQVAPERIAEIADGTSVSVVDYAKLPQKMSSPNITRNTLIGVIIGIVVCIAIVVFAEAFDTRLKTEDDFSVWGLPVLGIIPDFDDVKDSKKYGYGYGYEDAAKKKSGK